MAESTIPTPNPGATPEPGFSQNPIPEASEGQAVSQPEPAQPQAASLQEPVQPQAEDQVAQPQAECQTAQPQAEGQGAQAAFVPPFSGNAGSRAAQPQTFQPQPGYMPVQPPVPQLTGGMKFGYFALGFLGNLLGIVVSWLINADKHPAVRNDAIKWSVIGFAATFVIGIVIFIALIGMFSALATAVGAGAYAYDPTAYYYTF